MSTIAATNLKNPSAGSNNIVLGTDGSTRVTTLADSAGANTSTPAEIASGRAKAWVNLNGTGTGAIRASYNISSVTRLGAGHFRMAFTTAMADVNYAAVASGSQGLTDNDNVFASASLTTTTFNIISNNQTGGLTYEDASYMFASVFR